MVTHDIFFKTDYRGLPTNVLGRPRPCESVFTVVKGNLIKNLKMWKLE